jgi:anti-sigma factor RsiW
MTTISCGTVRRLLWPGTAVREALPEVISARQHVKECAQCRSFFEERNPLQAGLKEVAAHERAPFEVRQRLFAAIAEERTKSSGPFRGSHWLPIAAAAAVTLVAIALADRRFDQPALEQSFAAAVALDHGQWLHGGGISSSAQNEVSRWIATRVPYAVDVPAFPSAQLKGGRIARIEGKQAAVMLYELDAQPMSYFVLQLDATDVGARIERLSHSRLEGYQLVMWREPGLLHVLVGRVPTATLDQLALMCIAEARRASKA